MESPFAVLRNELNILGYYQTLTPDCVPLVEKLLDDLKTTTESLKKYMKISKDALEERDLLKLGAEPYKCDNTKLIKECNDLHLTFIQFKEKHERIERDLRQQITTLEKEKLDCDIERQELRKRVRDKNLGLDKKPIKPKSQTAISKSKDTKRAGSVMDCATEKISHLTSEVKKLRDQHLDFIKSNEMYKSQLNNRDMEIKRLTNLLEGGRPLEALNKECCYKNIDNKVSGFKDELKQLLSEKNMLQSSLKEALAKQHEAMRRALHLAERNKQLEKELKDIDQIALAVEAECNCAIKNNVDKCSRLQDRMNESIIMIQNLERENARLRQDKIELNADLDAIQLEKRKLQELLETEVEHKKTLTDRINNFNIIENDLNLEIDRLSRLSAEQKRKIAEMECQLTAGKLTKPYRVSQTSNQSKTARTSIRNSAKPQKPLLTKSPKKLSKTSETSKTKLKKTSIRRDTTELFSSPDYVDDNDEKQDLVEDHLSTKCCSSCVKHFKELLDREMKYRQEQVTQSLENLREEKEQYKNEYHKLVEQLKLGPSVPRLGLEKITEEKDYYMREYYKLLDHQKGDHANKSTSELKNKLDEKDEVIHKLQSEISSLSQEKILMSTRLNSAKDLSDTNMDNEPCKKLRCKRNERELELLREELHHLQAERDAFKNRAQSVSQTSLSDMDRLRRTCTELENQICTLEGERNELRQTHSSKRSAITHLEEQYELLKEQLRASQNELNNVKANYNQLKNLHEQTDRALSDTQGKLLQAESDLAGSKMRLSNTNRTTSAQENEIATLMNDLKLMKAQLSKLDKEKDELLNALDEKTEKIALLEEQLRGKSGAVTKLETELAEQSSRLSNYADTHSSQGLELRTSKSEITSLQKQLDSERKLNENLVQENRRLQDDLGALARDCKDARKDLEICERQVEDLKRQLQHYVAEVKRTEDILSHKELERNELLDQFKSLSQEANTLESSNHTLETEATQSRVQLNVALDHATELERRIDTQETMIQSYERQISELTSQVASLEIQLKRGSSQQEYVSDELKQLRDLCVKLNQDKDNLRRELISRDESRLRVENAMDKLKRENESLQECQSKDRCHLDGMEKLLSEARKDVIEQRLLNQDLQDEITRMKAKLKDLQERLSTTTEQLELHQNKVLDYSRQNKQLRRDIANERFHRARNDDSRRCPSL